MGKSGHYKVESVGFMAIWMNKLLSWEFRVFRRKWSLVALGGHIEI